MREDRGEAMRIFGTESFAAGMELHVYYPNDIAVLILQIARGDARASSIVRAGDDLINKTRKLPKRRRPLCLCCPARIDVQFGALAFLVPAIAAPSHSLGMFICSPCSDGLDKTALTKKACRAVLASWPDLREIPQPTHPDGGTA